MKTYLCHDSVDGVFCGVYDAWASRLGHQNVRLQLATVNLELFAEYRDVPVDGEKARKVAATIRRDMGLEDYTHIYQAALSKSPDKADCIYRTVVAGLAGRKGSVMADLRNPAISRVFEMSRNIGNEAHHYLGFVRFRELAGGVMFSEIRPDNQVLPLLGDHFANRFPGEHFMIYDITHQSFIVHEANKAWVILEGEALNWQAVNQLSDKERHFQELWRGFCRTIAIQERRNTKLQRQLLPLKFREYLPEEFD